MGCSKSLGGSAPGMLATSLVAAATTAWCGLGDSPPPSARQAAALRATAAGASPALRRSYGAAVDLAS